jgi:hypothetical protein
VCLSVRERERERDKAVAAPACSSHGAYVKGHCYNFRV